MKILLIGEASFAHYMLSRGLKALGHDVTLMSGGNAWHDTLRDIDLPRDMRRGWIGGLSVLWALWRNRRRLKGYDVVHLSHYSVIPLGMKWNIRFMRYMKKHNRCLMRSCYGDDPQTIERQLAGVPEYSEIYWNGAAQNLRCNEGRIAEQRLTACVKCWNVANELSEVIVPCLYEYYLAYNTEAFRQKLRYIGLPIELPAGSEVKLKGTGKVINVLVGMQAERDHIKGARRIASMVEEVRKRAPERLSIKYVENVPYNDYCKMISEADVLVDQLYSFTPSMNSLTAMARGTVVIGGGEEYFYNFIGETELRPIINVRPDVEDEVNIQVICRALLTEGNVARLSRESVEFVRRHHDARKIARQFISLYKELLNR